MGVKLPVALSESMAEGRVVLFAGAGMSAPQLPGWQAREFIPLERASARKWITPVSRFSIARRNSPSSKFTAMWTAPNQSCSGRPITGKPCSAMTRSAFFSLFCWA